VDLHVVGRREPGARRANRAKTQSSDRGGAGNRGRGGRGHAARLRRHLRADRSHGLHDEEDAPRSGGCRDASHFAALTLSARQLRASRLGGGNMLETER